MTTKTKVSAGVTAVIATAVSLLLLFSSGNHRGFYTKGFVDVLWLSHQNTNSVSVYNLGTTINSTAGRDSIKNYITRLKAINISSVLFPYSSVTGVSRCSLYNATTISTGQFTGLVSEIEPYNTGDYAGFYSSIIAASKYCKATGKVSAVYMGWPTTACWDSIVRYTDVIFLHCYVSSSKIATGAGQYSYLNGQLRLSNIAASAKRYGKKQNVVVIYSCEPAFSYDYFKTHTWDEPFTLLKTYFNTYATDSVKNNITLSGRQIFVSSDAQTIR